MSTVLVCDVCRRRDREAKRAEIWTGNMVPDAAGGPASREILIKDLCLSCAVDALERQCDLTGGGLR